MAASGSAIKAGQAFVELFVEDNKAYRALDRFGGFFKTWGSKFMAAGTALGAGGLAFVAPMLANLKEVVSRTADLQLFSDRIGGAVTSLSALQGGFEKAGVDADAFQSSIQNLRVHLSEAADANGYLDESMKGLGRAADLAKLGNRELLTQIAQYVKRVPDAVRQLRALQKAGIDQRLLPVFKRGRAGIDALFESGAAGAVSDEEGRQSVQVMQDLRDVWQDFRATVRSVGLALLPSAAGMADLKKQVIDGLKAARDWVRENRGVIVTAMGIGLGVVAAGVALTGLGLTMVVVGKAILLTLAAIKLAFAVAFSPVGALAFGMYLLARHTEAGRQSVAGLKADFAGMADVAKDTFNGVAAAVQAGDYAAAWKIALAGLKAEWAIFNASLVAGWHGFKSVFVDGWYGMIAGFKLAFVEVGAFILRNTVGVLHDALKMMAGMVQAMVPGIAGRKAARGILAAARHVMSDDEINAGHRRADDSILDAEKRRKERAAEHVRGARLDAQLAVLQAKLAVQEARNGIRPGGGGMWGGLATQLAAAVGSIGGAGAAGFHGPTRMADAVKGFSGAGSADLIGRQLAFGDTIPQQQLDATRGLLTVAEANLPQMNEHLNQLAQRGRVGQ